MLLADDATHHDAPSANIFDGKIIYVTVDESKDMEELGSAIVMIDVKLEQIGDRLFIVGTGYGGTSRAWYKDMTVGIAWENVNRFFALTSEQYESMEKLWLKADDEG
jgi:hypothetical protein